MIEAPQEWSELTPKTEVKWSSYSGLVMHRSCPQKWSYSTLYNLTKPDDPDDPKAEMHFGSWWHALRAADSIERGRELHSLQSYPNKIKTVDDGPTFPTDLPELIDAILSGAEDWWEALPFEMQEAWGERLHESLPDGLRRLDYAWRREHSMSLADERPLAIEMKWVRKLPGGKELVGYVDEIYLDTLRDLVVVRDHKTGKTLGTQSTADDMMNSQLHLYAWGVAPLVKGWGYRVQAVGYDRVRSTPPKTPKVNNNGSLSKSITDFDLHKYIEWCAANPAYPGTKKDGSNAGVYVIDSKVLESLETPAARSAWFQRTLTPINMNIVKAHIQAAIDSAEDSDRTVIRVGERGYAQRNLSEATCRYCPFVKLCRAQMIGGSDGEYVLEAYGLAVRPAKSGA